MTQTHPITDAAPRRAPRRWGALWFLTPGMLMLGVFVIAPVALIVGFSVFHRGRFGGVSGPVSFDNFIRLSDPIYLTVVGNSVLIGFITTLVALVLGYPAAFAISRLSPRWRTIALIAVMLPFWTNFLIRTYAWILLLNNAGWLNQSLRALGLTSQPLELLYTPGAVVTGLVYMYLPLMILPLYSSLVAHDASLLEAATNLGATKWRSFWTVTFPLSIPGVLTGSVFVFVPAMSNFVIPELLGGGKTALIGNLIRDQFLKARDWPFGATLALILTLCLVALLVAQNMASRRITNGPRERKGPREIR